MAAVSNSLSIADPRRAVAVAGRVRRDVGRVLCWLIVAEASLLGSGRMLHFGGVTAKMLLFVLAVSYTAWSLVSLDRIRSSTAWLLASFGVLLCFGIVNGAMHAANLDLIGEDVSPLLSVFILPFFELTIRSAQDLETCVRIILAGALAMAAAYLAVGVCVLANIISFSSLWTFVTENGSDDFIFESDTSRLFYKGSLFICIALILLLFRKGLAARAAACALFLSLFLLGTRGFFVALAICGILYVFIGPRKAAAKLMLGVAVVVLAALVLPRFLSSFGDKSISNGDRVAQIAQVTDAANPLTDLAGHGFGVGVPIRPEHMEIMYLEIFHKQGIIGLGWWALLIAMLTFRFIRALRAGRQRIAYPLFLSALFICVQSAMNPFLNNPIGMYPFMICFVGLGLARDDREADTFQPAASDGAVA